MKTFLKYSLLMAVVLVSMVALTACGGNSDDDLPDNYIELIEGVHRIEVSFSGSDQWRVSTMFLATEGYRGTDIYENGQKVNETAGGYYCEELRNYIVETGKKCNSLSVTIVLNPYSKLSSGDIEITLKGFIDGKQTNMKVWNVKASDPKSMTFSCQDIGADIIQ